MNPLIFLAAVPSWVWKWVGVGVAIIAAVVYVDRKATYRERAKCEAAAREAERKAGVQDQKAEALTKKDETDVNSKLLTQDEADRRTLEAVDATIAKARAEAAAAKRPADRCTIGSDDDAKRL